MAKLTRRALLATVAGIWITRRVSAATANTFIAGQITPAKSGTRLTLETKERQKFTYFTLEHPPRLVVDMINTPSNAALAALPHSLKKDDPLVKTARLGQKSTDTTRLVLDLKQPAEIKITALPPQGSLKHRVQIDLAPAKTISANLTAVPAAAQQNKPAPQKTAQPVQQQEEDPLMDLLNKHQSTAQGQPETPPAAQTNSPAAQKAPARRAIVVLDAGHGGKDPGATGVGGIREKNVVLATALEAKRRLEAKGCTVHLTRSGDSFVPLTKRRQYAQRMKADLFISIHANSSPNSQIHGAEVYVWGRANSEAARRVAETENQADRIDGLPDVGNKDVNVILTDMMQAQTNTDSVRFAKQLLAQFGKFAPLRKNTPETADFVVLRSINIPSVLIELGYLTNSAEEKQLDTAAQRRRFAAGIADAVEQYWKTAAR